MSTEPPLKGRQSRLSSQHGGHKGETRAVALSLTVLPSGTCNDSKANQKSSRYNLFTQSSVGKQLTTSVTDENNPRKAMLGSVLKGTGVEGFELDLRGSSLVLDKKKFKTDVLQRTTNSQQQWTTGKRNIVCQHRLNTSRFLCSTVCLSYLLPLEGPEEAQMHDA